MTLRYRLVVAVALLGCGTSSTSDNANPPTDAGTSGPDSGSGNPTVPSIKETPLAGTVDGKPFTFKTAVANYQAKSNVANVFIYDHDRTCADYATPQEEWTVVVAGPWDKRVVPDIGTEYSVIFRQTKKVQGVFANSSYYAREGRLEILLAPKDTGAPGRLRLRTRSPEGHEVEGEVTLVMCSVYPDRE